MCRQPDYIPPKKPYSFTRMIDDILEFAAIHLVAGGRLCIMMPTANHDTPLEEVTLPSHPQLEMKGVCVQVFNKCMDDLMTLLRSTKF